MIGDKLTRANNGVWASPATLTGTKNIADTTVGLSVATGWPVDATDGPVHVKMFKVDADDNLIEGSASDHKATLTGTTLSNIQKTGGPNVDYVTGDSCIIYPTAGFWNDIYDALIVSLNKSGSIRDAAINAVTQFAAGVISTTAPFSAALNPETRFAEANSDYVASGLAWSIISGLNAQMSAGVVYIAGKRIPISAVATQAFAINKDTYIDVNNSGAVVYTAVANNATTGMTLAAGHKRLCKVVTNGTVIVRIEHVGYDPLGNRFYNTVRMSPSVAFSNSTGSFGLNPAADDRTISGRWVKPYDIMTVAGTQIVRYQPFLRPSGTGNATLYRVSYIMRKSAAFVSLEPTSNTTVGQTSNIQTLPYPVTDQTMDTYWATYDLAAYEQDAILRVELKRDGANVADVNATFIEVEAMCIYYNKDYSKSA